MARKTTRRRRKRAAGTVTQRPWQRIKNPYKPIEVLSADQIEHIHRASLDVIETLGVDMWSDEGLDIFDAAGAEVDRANRHVRIDRNLIEEAVAKAPAEFTLTPRNPARAIVLGGNNINFAPVGGPGFSTDIDRGRRSGSFADACDLIRLSQCLEVIHLTGGGPVAATDMPVPIRHLETMRASLTLTDKVSFGSAFGGARVNDAIDMTCIVRGIDREALAKSPGVIGNINCNSPLRYDGPMTEGIIEFARAGQPIIVTPFTLAGAMAPITLAGALTQQNAEALIGIALSQLVNPGAPVVYGGFTSNVDMKTGAPAFGTPEYAKAVLAGGQLVRRYGIPYRSSNVNASNVVDAQAAYESQMSLWATVMGHCNLMLHGVGWLEGGLTASFEKMIIDAEMLQMMAAFLEPLVVDDATLGLEAMADVGPGGHFFGTAHTLERYETAFYVPMVSDWRNFETWEESGSLSATQRANTIWKQMLADYEQPAMDQAIAEELDAFVAKRSEEGGVPM
ncbi:MAG: trimethylamine methyltransferase family protein [Proteobacteria bacterium]|nr:trimethylamine methyltransferase family protein [Pseudomonadota bacterium]